MKKLLVTLTAGLLAWTSYGQGVVSFTTSGSGVNAPATNRVTNTRVTGTAFMAQLYWGAAGTPENALIAVTNAPAAFGAGGFAGYVTTGSGGGNRTLPVPNGTSVSVQVRAWEAVLGPNYETAFANWSSGQAGVQGVSAIIQTSAIEPSAGSPGLLLGLPFYYLNPVPEPSIIALGVLGGFGVLLLRRRRK